MRVRGALEAEGESAGGRRSMAVTVAAGPSSAVIGAAASQSLSARSLLPPRTLHRSPYAPASMFVG